jgi:hypothetical protein
MFAKILARKHEIERNFESLFPFCTNFVNICDMMRRGKKYIFILTLYQRVVINFAIHVLSLFLYPQHFLQQLLLPYSTANLNYFPLPCHKNR